MHTNKASTPTVLALFFPLYGANYELMNSGLWQPATCHKGAGGLA